MRQEPATARRAGMQTGRVAPPAAQVVHLLVQAQCERQLLGQDTRRLVADPYVLGYLTAAVHLLMRCADEDCDTARADDVLTQVFVDLFPDFMDCLPPGVTAAPEQDPRFEDGARAAADDIDDWRRDDRLWQRLEHYLLARGAIARAARRGH